MDRRTAFWVSANPLLAVLSDAITREQLRIFQPAFASCLLSSAVELRRNIIFLQMEDWPEKRIVDPASKQAT